MNQKKFERVWKRCENVSQVCQKMKISEASAYYWARKFGLPMFCGISDENTPTPEEIAERAAEIRKSWSEEEMARRVVGRMRSRYEIPSYSSSHSSSSKWPIFA